MIPGWIAIDCEPQCMTELQKQIKRLADSGKGPFEIGMKLHMGRERVIEEIYEIRKKECINSMAKRLTEEERARVIELKQAGVTYRDIAKQCYISPQTAANVWQAYQLKQQLDEAFPEPEATPEEKKPVATINPEFEAAVDAMIAESKAADAEEKSANAEPEKLPVVVRKAIDDKIDEFVFQIRERSGRIEEMEREIAEYKKDIEALKAWEEAHA